MRRGKRYLKQRFIKSGTVKYLSLATACEMVGGNKPPMSSSIQGTIPRRLRYFLAAADFSLRTCTRYFGVRTNEDCTPKRASITAFVLVMVRPIPRAMRNGRYKNVLGQLF